MFLWFSFAVLSRVPSVQVSSPEPRAEMVPSRLPRRTSQKVTSNILQPKGLWEGSALQFFWPMWNLWLPSWNHRLSVWGLLHPRNVLRARWWIHMVGLVAEAAKGKGTLHHKFKKYEKVLWTKQVESSFYSSVWKLPSQRGCCTQQPRGREE